MLAGGVRQLVKSQDRERAEGDRRLHGEIGAEEPRKRTLLRVLDLDPRMPRRSRRWPPSPRRQSPLPSIAPGRSSVRAGQWPRRPRADHEEVSLDSDDDLACWTLSSRKNSFGRELRRTAVSSPRTASWSLRRSPQAELLQHLRNADRGRGYESNGNYEQASRRSEVLLFDERTRMRTSG